MSDSLRPQSETTSNSNVGSRHDFLPTESIMRIKNLELRAKVIVEGFMSGLHRSPFHGFSVEFTDYRQYTIGDDLRYLDWKLLARGDRYYIKRFEDETNLRCYLLLDLSRSMAFSSGASRGGKHGSSDWTKLDYAKTIAATLVWFFQRQHDAVGLTTFHSEIVETLPPRFRPGHLRRMLASLERAEPAAQTVLSRPLERIAQTVAKRGLIILISDLLVEIGSDGKQSGSTSNNPSSLQQQLSYLTSRGHDVAIIRVLDPAEVAFDFDEALIFEDLESGRELFVDPQAVAADYRAKFERHAAEIQSICHKLGVDYFPITTEQPLDRVLYWLLEERHPSRSDRRGVRRSVNPSAARGAP